MSLRTVELQITIPRTHEAGKIQEQMQQRPLNDMAHLAEEEKKNIAKQQEKTAATEHAEQEKIKDQQKQNQSNRQNAKRDDQQKDQVNKQKIQHPYKGHSVDISL